METLSSLGENSFAAEVRRGGGHSVFLSYDDLNGANCQTVLPKKLTQREAAIEAVRQIGLRQKREMDMNKFGDLKKEAGMFERRLMELKFL